MMMMMIEMVRDRILMFCLVSFLLASHTVNGLLVPKPLATDIEIPNNIGFSTSNWGDEESGFLTGERMSKKQAMRGKFITPDTKVAFRTLMEGGISFCETGPDYGKALRNDELSSEQIVAQATAENWKASPLISTKYTQSAIPFLQSSGAVVSSLEKSLERLEASYVDLYQADFRSFSIGSRTKIAEGLATCMDRGLCTNVGVCNMRAAGVEGMVERLNERGVDLATNSIEFSLVNRGAMYDGTLKACQDLGVLPLARNPWGDGLASGVYTASNPTGGRLTQAQYDFKVLGPLKPLHDALAKVRKTARDRFWDEFYERKDANNRNYKLREIKGDFDREVTTAQISLLYVKAKGLIPIVNVNNKRDALELIGCLDECELTEEEVKILDNAAAQCGR